MRPVCAVDPEDPVIPPSWRVGEVAVIGLGRSGAAASRWLVAHGVRVYASDASDSASLRATAQALGPLGVHTDVGRHDLDRVARAAAVIASPGVPPDAAPLAAARDAGVTIRSELDLAAAALSDATLIVVTGTNGKSTTTALVAHLLSCAGMPAVAAGNIGRPLIDVALDPVPPRWLAVEASSFQLHDSPGLAPAVGVLTNLAPDHLDRYQTLEAYYADKRQLFRNATASTTWVLNGDDAPVIELARGVPGLQRTWRQGHPADAWFDTVANRFMLGDDVLGSRDLLPLLGAHNVDNALAAVLAVVAVGAPAATLSEHLATFRALPHRLEPVADIDGVLWINDSKATSPASTRVAIRSMTRPYVLLLGGRPKVTSFADLAPDIGPSCRAVVTFGEAAGVIAHGLQDAVRVVRVGSMGDAIATARTLVQPGDVVLLSPACTSFDAFADFEDRGDTFRRLVTEA
ncbi:MAG TPA: UDP-N-acetylmuramoyl-L-alanine--D-glutamate ligase [Gemmatimonadales bacterium]